MYLAIEKRGESKYYRLLESYREKKTSKVKTRYIGYISLKKLKEFLLKDKKKVHS